MRTKRAKKQQQGKYFPVCRYIHVIVTVLNYMTLKFFIYFVKTSVMLYKTSVRNFLDIFPYIFQFLTAKKFLDLTIPSYYGNCTYTINIYT